MARKRYKVEEIIAKLREAEVLAAQGRNMADITRLLGVTSVTYYRWRKEYGGMEVDQARRLKDFEVENARLKRVVADMALDHTILKEVAAGNF